MKKLLALFLLLIATSITAQNKYAVAAIPEALLTNANVVKRMEEQQFEVVSLQEARYIRKYALTILNEAGQPYSDLVVGYDKLHKVESIEGALFDGSGIQLKKVKSKDINDYSAVSDNSLYEDNRVKVHDFNYKSFPYTIEYTVEISYNNTFHFPDWMPQNFERLAVEQSSFTFIMPADYKLQYKEYNFKSSPAVTTEKGKKTMVWQAKSLLAIERPFASPLWNDLTTCVFFSPTDFEIEGYKGSATSWSSFGKFQAALNEGRDALPDDILQKVISLTTGVADPKEKVAKLYQYLQQNTRYISVQLGIGGYQPFEAKYVAQKGYGDCKALSNYMYSLLKAAGIKSYTALIRAGHSLDEQNILEDVPSAQFNHMILVVPLPKDTVWLECTSQAVPAGYMGSFTGNRKALIITEDGGKLVPTPRYSYADNLQLRTIKGELKEDGSLLLNAKTMYRAEQQDNRFSRVTYYQKDELKKWLNREFNFGSYDVTEFAYTPKKSALPELNEDLKIEVPNYATISGRRLFIVPNIMTRDGLKNIDTAGRKADYVFGSAYCDMDSVELQIPAGYTLEATYPEINLKTKYGNYHCDVKLEGNKIIYHRKIEKWPGRFPANEAAAIENFYTTVYKADRSRMVLVRKEEAIRSN